MNVYFSENKPINKVDSAWFSQAFKKKKNEIGLRDEHCMVLILSS